MKVIHCADLHLDAKMSANLDKESAKQRKGEILHTFERMIDYAKQNQVAAILIAGDLFDVKNISATARNMVLSAVKNHPKLVFYYLKGNHDSDNFLSGLDEIPDNLKLFGPSWVSYEEGNVVITGMELSEENAGTACSCLILDEKKFNIVMLHGQEIESRSVDRAEVINLRGLRGKGIDYLALGHVHTYKKERLDARGVYCYPGCLEGRGFDECGEHGFVLLDIDEATGRYTQEFVPFAYRKLYEAPVDVNGCRTTADMIERTKECLQRLGCSEESLIKIVLTGALDVECEKDVSYLRSYFKNSYFFVKVYDETSLKIAYDDYLLDESLKGEYVRMVMQDDVLTDEDKAAVIRYGLLALAGEEVQ